MVVWMKCLPDAFQNMPLWYKTSLKRRKIVLSSKEWQIMSTYLYTQYNSTESFFRKVWMKFKKKNNIAAIDFFKIRKCVGVELHLKAKYKSPFVKY